jgi:predicted amidophosphoribosyltransferase
MMIFLDPDINNSDEIISLGDYYSVNDSRFKTDWHSKAILNIKYKHDEDSDPQPWKQRNKTMALGNFRRRLDAMLSKDIAIAVVPPHGLSSSPSGIQELARLLAVKPRIDATWCLVRHTAIDKQARGGARSVYQHLQTIRVERAELILGRKVLLLDDVTTSGKSLEACKLLLLNAGAAIVKCAALGKTVSL